MFPFLVFFSRNVSTEYFKHVAHSPFLSSKCRLFHNVTFFGSCIIYIYIQGVLQFKCKTPLPNVKHSPYIEEDTVWSISELEIDFVK